jgi:hypothetical protein
MRYLAFMFLFTILGCSTFLRDTCLPSETYAVSDNLYFGRLKPNGIVSEQDWLLFLQEVVTPKFPNGFTTLDARGQWRSDAGVIEEEDSYILNIIYVDSENNRSSIKDIKAEYISRFQQKSVLRTRNTVCATF